LLFPSYITILFFIWFTFNVDFQVGIVCVNDSGGVWVTISDITGGESHLYLGKALASKLKITNWVGTEREK
jgi:hypothetical protein